MYRHSLRRLLPDLSGTRVAWCLAAALVLHVLSAWFNGGALHPDEHYQILEFAWYKLGHTPAWTLPWEFAERMRPTVQPWVAAGVIRALEAAGAFTPFLAAFVLRLLSSLLGLWVSLALCVRCLPWIRRPALRTLAFTGTLFLWVVPCLHARFSSENWSGALLFGGLCLVLDALDAWPSARKRALALSACAGLAWSVAFYCRFQIGLAFVGIGLWLLFVRKAPGPLLWITGVASAAGCALNTLADSWFYGAWVCSPRNYLAVNILAGRAASFGVSPWWATIVPFLLVLIPPFSLVLIGAVACGCWALRRNVLVWTTLAFIGGHALIGHKEARFMIPMVYAIAPLVALSIDALPDRAWERLQEWRPRLAGRLVVGLFCVADLAGLLVLTFAPVHETYPVFRALWDESRQGPVSLYTVGASPYLQSSQPILVMSYYRPGNLRVKPVRDARDLPPAGDPEPGERPLLFFEGFTMPPALAAAGIGCEPVARTLPDMLVRADRFGWLRGVTAWTVCRPVAAPQGLARRRAE